MSLLLVLGCTGRSPALDEDTSSASSIPTGVTAATANTADTANPLRPGPPIPPGFKRRGQASDRAGWDVSVLVGERNTDAWLVGAPTSTTWGLHEQISKAYVAPTARTDSLLAWGAVTLFEPRAAQSTHSGQRVLGAGDLTGDGWGDVLVSSILGGMLVVGPFEALLQEGDPFDLAHSIEQIVEFPPEIDDEFYGCGSLLGDETHELCVAGGVIAGPVGGSEDLVLHTAWSTDGAALVGAEAGDPDGDGTSGVWLSDGYAGVLWHIDVFPPGEVAPEEVADLTAGFAPYVAAEDSPFVLRGGADLTGDGRADALVGHGARLWVFAPDGAGGLAEHAWLELETPVWQLEPGDFDGDGQSDLAVSGGHQVWVFLGPLGPGALTLEAAAAVWAGERFPADRFGWALAVQDYDHDGRDDLGVGAPDDHFTEDKYPYGSTNYQNVYPWGSLYVIPAAGL